MDDDRELITADILSTEPEYAEENAIHCQEIDAEILAAIADENE